VAFFALLTVLAGAAIPSIRTGVPFEDNFPDGSYFTKHHLSAEAMWEGSPAPANLVIGGADFALPETQARMERALRALEVGPHVRPPVVSWLRVYRRWVALHPSADPAANASVSFGASLAAFLEDETYVTLNGSFVQPATFRRDLVLDPATGGVRSSRMLLRVAAPTGLLARIDVMTALRQAFAQHCTSQGLQGYLYTYYFLFSDRDEVVHALVSMTLATAALAVILVLFLFVSARTVLAVLACIVFIDVGLLGVMALWDVPIDVSAFICLVRVVFIAACTSSEVCVVCTAASVGGWCWCASCAWRERSCLPAFARLAQRALTTALCIYCRPAPAPPPAPPRQVIAVGLSVDYVVHLGHAYEHSTGPKAERAAAALREIGMSVFRGGGSTFLGIILLAFAQSAVFRLFFKMLFSIIILGMSAGLMLFPALVSLIGADVLDVNAPEADVADPLWLVAVAGAPEGTEAMVSGNKSPKTSQA
jgi:hypothetical protein